MSLNFLLTKQWNPSFPEPAGQRARLQLPPRPGCRRGCGRRRPVDAAADAAVLLLLAEAGRGAGRRRRLGAHLRHRFSLCHSVVLIILVHLDTLLLQMEHPACTFSFSFFFPS